MPTSAPLPITSSNLSPTALLFKLSSTISAPYSSTRIFHCSISGTTADVIEKGPFSGMDWPSKVVIHLKATSGAASLRVPLTQCLQPMT